MKNNLLKSVAAAGLSIRVRESVCDCSIKLAAHDYDEPQLNEVIGSLNRLLAHNRLSARERKMLTDDLNRMREYPGALLNITGSAGGLFRRWVRSYWTGRVNAGEVTPPIATVIC
jgi:hypothetical protein